MNNIVTISMRMCGVATAGRRAGPAAARGRYGERPSGARTHTAARRPIAARRARTPSRRRYAKNLVFLRKTCSFCASLGCERPRAYQPP